MNEIQSRRLDSWKEIAEYLGRDLRTVSRWEKEKGLPVHRVPGGKRGAVFAYSEEIDLWLQGQSPESVTAVRESIPAQYAARLAFRAWLRHWTAPWAAMIFVLLVVLVVIPYYRASRAGTPVRVTISQQKLFAWDDKGHLAWEYNFPEPTFQLYPMENARLVRFEDLDGDGSQELIAVAAFEHSRGVEPRTVVFCFSSAGKLLWKYEPGFTLKFHGREFEGPWRVKDMLVTSGAAEKAIWLAYTHQTWWPSFVVKLDARGGAAVQFVNAGWILLLDRVQNRSGNFVLAAGLNNEYESAILAVLGEDQNPSASPQKVDSAFQYEPAPLERPQGSNQPHWFPHRYFTFAPAELFRLQKQVFHQVVQLNIREHRIEVMTGEGKNPADGAPYLASVYEISTDDFALQSATLGDTYWNVHRQLEKEGKIAHSAEYCPERNGVNRVRVWLPSMGWTRPAGAAN